jgi:hypothetical protein
MSIKTGFRGNSNLKRKGESIDWTPELIDEFIKCRDDIFYFIEKYYKIVTQDGLVGMVLRDYQIEIIKSMQENRFTMMVQSRQSGKALCLNTPIFTPNGMKLFKDVHTGDEIYSIDGKKTKIVFETEIMNNHKCFNVEFSHGEIIICDEEHVWNVEYNKKKINIKTNELKKLLEKQHLLGQSVRIKIPDPIEYDKKDLLIDPYLLGVWLGDGTKKLGYFTCYENDLEEYKKYFEIEKITSDCRFDHVKTVKIKDLISKLKTLNLYDNKHIPDDYIFNSIENRIALVQGLMDTDGSVTEHGSFEFYQKNIDLINQFKLLLSSLGVKSTTRSKIIKGQTYYTVAFCNRNFDFFRLERKLQTTKNRSMGDAEKNYYFYFKTITETDSVPVKCIQVDNNSHLFLCGNSLIPTHNTEALRAFLIHYILFNDYKTVAIVANMESTANEIVGKIELSYQHLPHWLQHGILEFNKGSFILDNQSRIFASATSSNSLRGYTCHIVVVDEAAHIEKWEEFYAAIGPTISAGTSTKLIMASTPNGLNHYYEFWEGSSLRKGTNNFHSFFVTWDMVPGRDEAWKEQILKSTNYNYEKFDQEYNVQFLGSSGTLISGWKLKILNGDVKKPITTTENDKFKIYDYPIKELREIQDGKNVIIPPHIYALVADVSRGKGLDYSAFSIFDVTALPYKQIATYRDNQITPTDYAEIIYKTAQFYNKAIILTEINDIGEMIGSNILENYEYEGILCTESAGRAGKKICLGGKKVDIGIRTTPPVKLSGCLLLKLLVEQNKLIIPDKDTIDEMNVFSKNKNTYKAEQGKHDDLMMTLVLFSWLTNQDYFKEMTDINVVESLREQGNDFDKELLQWGYFQEDPKPQAYNEYVQNYNLNLPWNPYYEHPADPQIVPNF